MTPRLLFNVSAIGEVLIGTVLLLAPAYVISLLLGDGLGPTGTVVARVLGIGLLSLGVAAMEPARPPGNRAARIGLCTYNLGVALLLAVIGTIGEMSGMLLWPAAGLHGLLGAAMLWVILPQLYRPSAD